MDPTLEPEPQITQDIAERVEKLIGPPGIGERIRELEGMDRREMAFKVAEEIVLGRFGRREKEAAADQAIRTALAMGADEGVLIDDPAAEGGDALGTAKVLAAALKENSFDLIVGDEIYEIAEALASKSIRVGTQLVMIHDFLGFEAVSSNPLEKLLIYYYAGILLIR